MEVIGSNNAVVGSASEYLSGSGFEEALSKYRNEYLKQ